MAWLLPFTRRKTVHAVIRPVHEFRIKRFVYTCYIGILNSPQLYSTWFLISQETKHRRTCRKHLDGYAETRGRTCRQHADGHADNTQTDMQKHVDGHVENTWTDMQTARGMKYKRHTTNISHHANKHTDDTSSNIQTASEVAWCYNSFVIFLTFFISLNIWVEIIFQSML